MRYLILCIAALALTACDKGDTPADAPAAAKTPKSPSQAPVQKAKMIKKGAATAKAAGSQPMKAAGSQPMKAAGSQPMKAAGSQPSKPTTGKNGQFHPTPKPGGGVKGEVTLLPALHDKVKKGMQLYVIVRRDEGANKKGMLLAAKKLPVSSAKDFPMKFLVTTADVMMKGTALWGRVKVDVRLDADGDALSKQPGDLVGGPVKSEVGKEETVKLTLDKAL